MLTRSTPYFLRQRLLGFHRFTSPVKSMAGWLHAGLVRSIQRFGASETPRLLEAARCAIPRRSPARSNARSRSRPFELRCCWLPLNDHHGGALKLIEAGAADVNPRRTAASVRTAPAGARAAWKSQPDPAPVGADWRYQRGGTALIPACGTGREDAARKLGRSHASSSADRAEAIR